MNDQSKYKEKSISTNYIFNTLYTMLNILFPMITIAYISRILLPAGVGMVSFAINIASYFLVIAQLGIPKYGAREIAKKRDCQEACSNLFWEVFILNTVSTLLAVACYYYFVLSVDRFSNNRILMSIIGLTVVFNFFNVDWFYTGMEEYKYITLRSTLIKILSLVLLIIFVRDENDYIAYALIYCLGIGANYSFNIIHLRKYLFRPSQQLQIKKHLKPVFLLLSMTIAVELYSQLDTTMIGFLCTSENVAFYTNPMKMIKIITVLVTSLSTVLLPRLSWYYEKNMSEQINKIVNLALKIVLLFSVPACIGVCVVAEPLVYTLFGINYEASIRTIRILSLLIPVMAVGNLFGTQILIVVNQEKKLLISVAVGAIVNVILNSILIPRYYQDGAAFSSVIAETTVMILQVVFASRYVDINFGIKYFVKVIAGGISIFSGLFILKLNINNIYKLIMMVITGVTMFCVIELLLKNEVLKFIIDILKRKVKLASHD